MQYFVCGVVHIEEIFSVDQLAERYGVKKRTVQTWIYQKRIKSRKIRQKRYFTLADIEDFEAREMGRPDEHSR